MVQFKMKKITYEKRTKSFDLNKISIKCKTFSCSGLRNKKRLPFILFTSFFNP